MLETKLLTFRIGSAELPSQAGESVAVDINLYPAETLRVIGEGWTPLSHAITPVGADVLLSILVTRETVVPDFAPDSGSASNS